MTHLRGKTIQYPARFSGSYHARASPVPVAGKDDDASPKLTASELARQKEIDDLL